MDSQVMSRQVKIAAALVAVVLLAVLLSIGPVRSSVADFLRIFRMEKIDTVDISFQDLAKLEHAMKNGGKNIDIQNFGKVAVEGREETKVVSLEEAQKAVDFPLMIPNTALNDFGSPTYKMQAPIKISLTLDIQKVNSLITSFGSDNLLPDTIDGKTFTLNVPTIIRAEYPAATPGSRPLIIAQARSPEIIVPKDVDVDQIRDALLSLEVLPENLRSQLAAVNDWQQTMLVPNIDGSTQKVSVNGLGGVFVSPPDHTEQTEKGGALIWPQDGIITVIQGEFTLENALAIATQMK